MILKDQRKTGVICMTDLRKSGKKVLESKKKKNKGRNVEL